MRFQRRRKPDWVSGFLILYYLEVFGFSTIPETLFVEFGFIEFKIYRILVATNRVPTEYRSLVQELSNPHGYAVFATTS